MERFNPTTPRNTSTIDLSYPEVANLILEAEAAKDGHVIDDPQLLLVTKDKVEQGLRECATMNGRSEREEFILRQRERGNHVVSAGRSTENATRLQKFSVWFLMRFGSFV